MEVSTRFAIEDDLEVLATFEREVAILSFPDDPIVDLKYHFEKLKRAMRTEPDGMVALTVEEEVVGWLWMTTKVALPTRERYGVLRSIFIRADLRTQGLAKSLAQYCIRYFESRCIHRIVCKIHRDNASAKALLQRVGLEPVHITYEYRTPLHPAPPPLADMEWDSHGGEPFG
jgi:ribosomal protein S18 acetylase RimI-like enzyme